MVQIDLSILATLVLCAHFTAAFDPEEDCRKVDGPCLLTQKYCEDFSGVRGCTFPEDLIVLTKGAVRRPVYYTSVDYTIKWTNTNDKYPTRVGWTLGPRQISYNVTAGQKEHTFKFEDVAALNGTESEVGYWQALANGFAWFGNHITIGQPDNPAYKDESLGGSILDFSTQFALMPIELKSPVADLAPKAVSHAVHKWKLGVGIGVGLGVPILMLLAFTLGWKMPGKDKTATKVESA